MRGGFPHSEAYTKYKEWTDNARVLDDGELFITFDYMFPGLSSLTLVALVQAVHNIEPIWRIHALREFFDNNHI